MRHEHRPKRLLIPRAALTAIPTAKEMQDKQGYLLPNPNTTLKIQEKPNSDNLLGALL